MYNDTRRPWPAPDSPKGAFGSTPRHTLSPSPPLPPPTYRSNVAAKYSSPDIFGPSTTSERSCATSLRVKLSWPCCTDAAELEPSPCTVATPSSDDASSKSSDMPADSRAANADCDRQRISLLLTYVASTDAAPKRHNASPNGRNPTPNTRTPVKPTAGPLLGLRNLTRSGS